MDFSQMDPVLDERVAAAFPILRTIEWSPPRVVDGITFNAVGARTPEAFRIGQWREGSDRIAPNEQLFEWVTIVETVAAAGDRYVMADLGAGYGRWVVNSAILARRSGRTPFVIGVEAEDTHYSWMKEHLADNEISSSEQRLFHAPITGKRQDVPFTVGHPKDWYGQAVLPNPETGFGHWPNARVMMRRSVVLEDVLGEVPVIDLLDLDIQGLEAEVVSSSVDLIAQRVKRLHIGTHSREIEDTLRKLMTTAGWHVRFDYPCASSNYPTLAGPVDFGDGVQTWINPRFV
jgi:hypothetical protein